MCPDQLPTPERTIAGRYRLLSQLGRGGMGTVWLAEDCLLGRSVAVKELSLPAALTDEERATLRERSLREARAAARLDHPSAVTVYDVVEEAGRPYIVMEFVPARTLAEILRESGPLSPAKTARVGLAVLGALRAAHAVGIVHRDVKPGNVLVREDGHVVLTDFGIATQSGDPSITSTGVLLGSPSYMAPERANGREPAPESDLWSLGATLFAAVEGRPPFDAGEPLATLIAVVSNEHAPFQRAGPLAPVIGRLLDKEPSERPSAVDVEVALRAVANSDEGYAETDTAAVPTTVTSADAVGGRSARTSALPPVSGDERVEKTRHRAAAVAGLTAAPPPAAAPPRLRATRGRQRRLGPLVAVAAILLVVAVVAAVSVLTTRRGGVDGAGARISPSSGASTRPTTAAAAGAAVPKDWKRYRSTAGWAIAYPPDWKITTRTVGADGLQTYFTEPGGRRKFQVDVEERHGASPAADWRAFAPVFGARNPGYQEIRIEPVAYRDYETADWEFTYGTGGKKRHGLDRATFTPKGAYALYVEAAADEWMPFQRQVDSFFASFQPGP